jgi:hypothetical protein
MTHENLMSQGQMRKLKTSIHKYEEILEEDGIIEASDFECSFRQPQWLKKYGALKVHEKVDNDNGSYYVRYKWRPKVRERLLEYREKMNKLPCGHRWHIYNPPNSELMGCKHCDATFSKETVRQCKE